MSRVPESERVPDSATTPRDAAHPGGPDTPWPLGFVAGCHLNMDALRAWLTGDGAKWSKEKISTEVQKLIDFVNDGQPPERADEMAYETGSLSWHMLVNVYYDHLKNYLQNARGIAPENPEDDLGLAADIAARADDSEVGKV